MNYIIKSNVKNIHFLSIVLLFRYNTFFALNRLQIFSIVCSDTESAVFKVLTYLLQTSLNDVCHLNSPDVIRHSQIAFIHFSFHKSS